MIETILISQHAMAEIPESGNSPPVNQIRPHQSTGHRITEYCVILDSQEYQSKVLVSTVWLLASHPL